MKTLAMAVVTWCLFSSPVQAQAMRISTFDTDADGWAVNGGVLYHHDSSGNPGGFIEFMDDQDGAGVFVAPTLFLGDLSSFSNGSIKFDLMNTNDNGQAMLWGYGRVRISSPVHIAERSIVPLGLLTSWSTFDIPLTANEWGVTESAWDSLLAEVTEISLQADAQWDYFDRVGLDNFCLIPFNTPVGNISETTVPVPSSVLHNYPNPFNSNTHIRFTVPAWETVTIKVFNVTGSEITTLTNGEYLPGTYEVDWRPVDLPSGPYFCLMQAGGVSTARRILLLR